MAIQMQFSMPTSAFKIDRVKKQWEFPDPLGNAFEVPKDAAKAEFVVVTGWLGKPGDAVTTRIVILNPNAEPVFDMAMPPETITDQLLAVVGVKLDFPFGVSGWHKIQIYDDQKLHIEYPVRVRRSDMTTAAMEREQRKRRQERH